MDDLTEEFLMKTYTSPARSSMSVRNAVNGFLTTWSNQYSMMNLPSIDLINLNCTMEK